MRRLFVFIAAFLLGFLASDLLVTAVAAEVVTPQIKAKISALELKVFQLENKRKLAKDPVLVDAQLVHTVEQLVGYSCLTKKKGELGLWGNSESEGCLTYIAKLTGLQPRSGILVCATNGQESEACEGAFLAQQALPFSEANSSLKLKGKASDLPKSFSRYNSSLQVKALKKEIANLENIIKTEKSVSSSDKLMVAYSKLVNAECTNDMLILYRSSEELGTRVQRFTEGNDPEINRLQGLIEEFQNRTEEKKKPTGFGLKKPKKNKSPVFEPFSSDRSAVEEDPKPSNLTPLVRVHVLSDNCFIAVDGLLRAFPLSSLGVCARDGGFSPSCIKARKQKLGRKKETSQTASHGAEF